MTTAVQIQYLAHKQACVEMGIPQVTYLHRKLKGTTTVVGGTKNRVYTGGGPRTDLGSETTSIFQVWCVHQPFLRGEQRTDDPGLAILAVQIKQAQFAAIDDQGATIPATEDDIIVDGSGTQWRVTNPVISPDNSFWSCLLERFR